MHNPSRPVDICLTLVIPPTLEDAMERSYSNGKHEDMAFPDHGFHPAHRLFRCP